MDLNQLKTQVMTMFMMKSSSSEKKGSYDEIFMLMYSMVLMNCVEYVFKYLPTLSAKLQAFIISRFFKAKQSWPQLLESTTTTAKKEEINSITLLRTYGGQKADKYDSAFTEKVDAVIDYLSSIDSAKHVRIENRCSVSNKDEIEITPLLKARVSLSQIGEEAQSVEILLFSTVLKVSEIRQWIDEIHNQYCYERSNKLGNKCYYFNEIPVEPVRQFNLGENGKQDPNNFTYRLDSAPKALMFTMNEFHTSKSFGNVYGDHVEELKERLNLFIKHPEWYIERGIPHSLGIMLHGIPGAGKTSTIKAIAKDTNRHIFNLSLRPYTTQRQLTNLFLNESVTIMGSDGNKQTLKIPLNRRVYVIEDIDCLTNVVLDRSLQNRSKEDDMASEAVNLSFLLNLLDGVLETPGRILVITSNYPEKLDRALVRPGRIDVKIKFSNASRAFIHEMIEKFYTLKVDIAEVPQNLEGIFTPAEVMESCCYYFKDYKRAIQHMCERREGKQAQRSQPVPEPAPKPQPQKPEPQQQNIIEVGAFERPPTKKIGLTFSEDWVKDIANEGASNPYDAGTDLSETYQKMMSGPMFQSSLTDLNNDEQSPGEIYRDDTYTGLTTPLEII